MAKTKISEWSATPSNNTDIDGINIAEGCAPSGINDAIREMMSQVKDLYAGTSGDVIAVTAGGTGVATSTGSGNNVLSTSPTLVTPVLGTPTSVTLTNATGLPISTGVSGLGTGIATALAVNTGSAGAPVLFNGALGTPSSGTVTNLTGTASININGTVGATTPTTGAFTTVAASSSVTLSGGTANGVAYLNGSKVVTSGSGLVFDGNNLGLNVTPSAWSGQKAIQFEFGAFSAGNTLGTQVVSNAYYDGTNWIYRTTNPATRSQQNINGHQWFNAASGTAGATASFTQAMTLDASGNLGIGVTTLGNKLEVNGGINMATSTATIPSYGMMVASGVGTQITSALHTAFYNNGSERARIDSSGNLAIGDTANSAAARLYVKGSGATSGSVAMVVRNSTPADLFYIRNDGYMTFGVSTKMTLDASGNLGVGTTTMYNKLNVYSTTSGDGISIETTGAASLAMRGATENRINGVTNVPLTFRTNNTEYARIDTSGNFGLGVTPSAWGSGKKVVQIQNSYFGAFTGGAPLLYLGNNHYDNGTNNVYSTTGNNATLYQQSQTGEHRFFTAPSGTAGNAITFTQAMTLSAAGNLGLGTTSPTAVSNYVAQTINGTNGSFTEYQQSASNTFRVGSDSSDGGFLFTQSAVGIRFGINGVEKARIDSSGNLLVGKTATASNVQGAQLNATGAVWGITTSTEAMYGYRKTSTTTDLAVSIYSDVTANQTRHFSILANGNAVNTNNSYGAISDVKLKENIVDASPKLADLMQVKVRNYNLIGDTTKQIGVVAQELETVFPSMIDETPDIDAEGNDLGTTTKGVKYSVFVPMLIKAIQELKAEFDAYKASHP